MHLIKGTASKVIPIVVRRERIDLLVVGMFSRRGLGGWLIGNTAEKILNQVKCSAIDGKTKRRGCIGRKAFALRYRESQQ